MASTYSPTLRLELIGTGEQSGLWGDTTNTNLGALIEQAITGVESIPMLDANYTLTALNGSVDEARNAVLIFTSGIALTATRDVIIPNVEKIYIVKNSTTGSQSLNVTTSGGAGITVPNGQTVALYCDGTNCFQQTTYLNSPTIASPTINTPTINTPTITTPTISNATLTGTPTAPTAGAGTNTTQVATTAFVTTAVNNAFPPGTRLMFAQSAAPTGWTQITTDEANNRMLRVVSTAGAGTGGSNSPILNNVVPSHTHGYSTTTGAGGVDHTHGISGSGTTSAQSNDHTHGYSGSTGLESADHTHYTSGTTGAMNSNASHSHSGGDYGHNHTDTSVTGGGSVNFNGGGWANLTGSTTTSTGYASIYINAANIDHTHSWGNWSSGVNANHYHSFSGTSGGVSANHTHTWSFLGTSAGASAYSHTHSVSGTTDSGSSQTNWTPRYIDMILCSKN